MRRKDRERSKDFAISVLDKCEWSVISMVDKDGLPYCVPISTVRENNEIYFHTAKVGFKIDCLNSNPNVCISCVGNTNLLPEEFSTEYESAIIRGKAFEITEDSEKIHALKLLCEKYAPKNMENFTGAIERSLARTGIWKIKIESITGKAKERKPQ